MTHITDDPRPSRRRAENADAETSSPTSQCGRYQPPRLHCHGPLGALIRGASWKGMDSVGELDPDRAYPG